MEKTSLCRGWQFWLDETGETALDRDRAAWRPVVIPHDWMIWRGDGCLEKDGTGWYRRVLTGAELGRLFPGRGLTDRIALYFEGAYMDVTVFVNGAEAGEWKNGYTSFHVDVTDLLTGGEDELLVRCVLKHPNSRWYAGAGLYRPVELWRMPAAHLTPHGVYAAPREGAAGAWTVRAAAEIGLWDPGEGLEGVTAVFRVFDPEGGLPPPAPCRPLRPGPSPGRRSPLTPGGSGPYGGRRRRWSFPRRAFGSWAAAFSTG